MAGIGKFVESLVGPVSWVLWLGFFSHHVRCASVRGVSPPRAAAVAWISCRSDAPYDVKKIATAPYLKRGMGCCGRGRGVCDNRVVG